jgi:uncharacterized protein (TIGR02001 family)
MKIVRCMLVVGLLGVVTAEARKKGPELADTAAFATVDLASAYVFRGVTYNDGLVIQPSVELIGFGLPKAIGTLSAGMWANYNIDEYGSFSSDTISEVDFYAFYALPLDALKVSIGYVRYAYPNQTDGAVSNAVSLVDDSEAVAEIAYEMDELKIGARAFYGLDGAVEENLYYDASVEYTMDLSDGLLLDVKALVGYADPKTGASGWNEGVGEVGLRYLMGKNWTLGASAAYIYQIDDEVLLDEAVRTTGAYGYDVDMLFKLSATCLF